MINFITSNYLSILIVVMIIIFALIGKYVDKMNFFASYKDKPKNKIDLSKAEENFEKQLNGEDLSFETPEGFGEEEQTGYNNLDEALFAPIDGVNEYNSLNKEVSSVLSKKDLIDDDLLSDIEHLSLDKTQRYNFGDIPDLDDVELPKIKKEEEPEDIWKF